MFSAYEMLTQFTILVASTFVLARASCSAVTHAEKISRLFGISQFAVGMLLVSVATSVPDFSVAMVASLSGSGGLVAGNVFGSTITTLLLVLGLGAFFYGLKVERRILEDTALVIMITAMLSLYIIFYTQISNYSLGHMEGIILVSIFCWYVFKIFFDKMISLNKGEAEYGKINGKFSKKESQRSLVLFFFAIALVIVSSRFVVGSAIEISGLLGFEQAFIGATFLAIGTSLPELTVVLQALRKGHSALALGDAMGSVISNTTLVLGTAAIVSPISVQLKVFSVAMMFAIVASLVFFYFAAVKRKLGKPEGAIMIFVFIAYLAIISLVQLGFLGGIGIPCVP